MDSQIAELEDRDNEWAIERIVSHTGKGESALFEAEWKSGDRTWVPYSSIRHLGATAEYLDLLGCADITELKAGKGQPPDDPQVYLGSLGFSTAAGKSIRTHRHKRRARR